ncbi:MAG: DUF2461 domain-containing protein [Chloroflexaceae bacterium]|nr:DUF2461 domain-containing protein [Chloroflexaceae bacterium]
MTDTVAFHGFPAEGRQFFAELAANNNREWFAAHKAMYQRSIQQPAQAFTQALGERLQHLAPDIQYDLRLNGSGSIMRIYRDTRFSKDKSPYKTNLGIVFWQGQHKKTESPGFYFHLDSTATTLYTGIYTFPPPMLADYRQAVDDTERGSELAALIATLQHAGYTIGGESFKRVPRGFAADHPRANLLRHSGISAMSPVIDETTLCSPTLIDVCYTLAQTMLPLHQWLVRLPIEA